MSWFEDPAFWDETAFFMFNAERLAATPGEVDAIVELLGLPAPAHVLDLCCGPGRHSLELRRRGYEVTGVDLHQPYLDQARAKGPDIEWVRADMREFRRENAFDAAISMFTSLAYFEDPGDDLRVARNLCDSLRPGGRLLLDTQGKESLAKRASRRRWSEPEEGLIVFEHSRILDDWRSVRTTWTLLRGTERREFTHWTRLYSAHEMSLMLKEAGFGRVAFHGALDGRPYDDEALRLVAVATKDA